MNQGTRHHGCRLAIILKLHNDVSVEVGIDQVFDGVPKYENWHVLVQDPKLLTFESLEVFCILHKLI